MLKSAVGRTTLKAVGQSSLTGPPGSGDGTHPNLGLHSAAASGNIGLVKFALENGQLANSNLNGILPLHAACSGGSEQAVRMLIYHGADVNAPRLKSKSTSGPGAEGSTPLHFAAANGHLEIARILLEAGARPAAADKDSVTPVALALGNSHQACASLIRSWISAYGSNGLAGMVSSRDTVSGDVALGPAGYIRYAAGTSDATAASPTIVNASLTSSLSNPVQTQTSHETLSQPSKQPGTRSNSTTSKPPFLTRTSSNPSLRVQDAAVTPTLTSSPAPSSASSSRPMMATSPVSSFASLPSGQPQLSPASLEPEQAFESAFAPSVTAAELQPPALTPLAPVQLRESKRRPSLPSIIEKAAHPAATIRAALASGSSTPFPLPNNGADPYRTSAASPSKKLTRLAGKRSLSNILRKATGSSTLSTASSTATLSPPQIGDASASSASSDSSSKPGRTTGQSFEHQQPPAIAIGQRDRRNTDSDSTTIVKPVTAPSYQTSFALPQWNPSSAEAPARDFRLRSASASSTPAHQNIDDVMQRVGRARSIPSDHAHFPSMRNSRTEGVPDLLRSGYHPSNQGFLAASPRVGSADKVDGTRNDDGAFREERHELRTRSSSTTSSIGAGTVNRSASSQHDKRAVDDAESLSGPLDYDHRGDHEGHTPSRILNAVPQQRSNSSVQADGLAPAETLLAVSSARQTRNRSGSSLSAVSSESRSGLAAEQGSSGSPNLTSMYQTLSVFDGQNSPPDTPTSQPGFSTNVGSQTSPLRFNNLSAAEQALAILSQEGTFATDGPDGTSMSLAAQLAAYGEALASERTGAGEARTGPSPILSARGSNAALRSKLPSVSEDQSPSRPNASEAPDMQSTSFRDVRAPKYPATAAQSYHRRVSRRPTSSEGNETHGSLRSSSTTRALSPAAGHNRSTPVGDTIKHAGLRTLFLDAPRGPEIASPSNPALGSPLHTQSSAGWSSADAKEDAPRGDSPASTTDSSLDNQPEQASPDVPARKRHVPPPLPAKDLNRVNNASFNPDMLLDDPTTPVLSGHSNGSFDVYATSPHSAHGYSPSVPTELASYTLLRRERSPGPLLNSSISAGLAGPVPPPRKESMHSPNFSPNTSGTNISTGEFLTPDAAHHNRVMMGREGSLEGPDSQSGRWESLKRPSVSMLRTATSSSSRSHSTISHGGDDSQQWSADESGSQLGSDSGRPIGSEGASSAPGRGGKRRLVRNLLGNIKGSS